MTYFVKATEAHTAAVEAEKTFDADPTLENARRAYDLARATIKTGGTPHCENVNVYRVTIKTLALRSKALGTPKPYEPKSDVVTLTISGNRLIMLLDVTESYLNLYRHKGGYGEVDESVQIVRDLIAEARSGF
jgi:hypothetical protein